MATQITGKFFIRVNGILLGLTGDASLSMGGEKREPVVLNDGTVKYKSTYEAATVECTAVHDSSMSVKDLQAIKDATINVEADTGTRWVVSGAFCTDVPKVSSSGEVEIKFAGGEATEVAGS